LWRERICLYSVCRDTDGQIDMRHCICCMWQHGCESASLQYCVLACVAVGVLLFAFLCMHACLHSYIVGDGYNNVAYTLFGLMKHVFMAFLLSIQVMQSRVGSHMLMDYLGQHPNVTCSGEIIPPLLRQEQQAKIVSNFRNSHRNPPQHADGFRIAPQFLRSVCFVTCAGPVQPRNLPTPDRIS